LLSDQRELFAENWVAEKLQEYLRLKPDEALPCYVYAVSLPSDVAQSVRLLERALQLDPSFADAHLALGPETVDVFLSVSRSQRGFVRNVGSCSQRSFGSLTSKTREWTGYRFGSLTNRISSTFTFCNT
jgi:hypothetical protein